MFSRWALSVAFTPRRISSWLTFQKFWAGMHVASQDGDFGVTEDLTYDRIGRMIVTGLLEITSDILEFVDPSSG